MKLFQDMKEQAFRRMMVDVAEDIDIVGFSAGHMASDYSAEDIRLLESMARENGLELVFGNSADARGTFRFQIAQA